MILIKPIKDMYYFKKYMILFIALILLDSITLSQKLNIDEVVKIAIENNQEIKTAKLNIKKEEAIKLKSFNIPRPELLSLRELKEV